MSDIREFENKFPDYSSSLENKIPPSQWQNLLLKNIGKLLENLEIGLKDTDHRDYSVYTGISGIALLYLHLAKILGPEKNQEYLRKAVSYAEIAYGNAKNHRISFLCGSPGPIAINAVLCQKTGRQSEAQDLLKRLEKLHKDVIDLDSDLPDELLYGRVGYLYSLLFVQKHMGEACISKSIIKNVVETILKSGQELAAKEKHPCPLMYAWHDKHYFGAAHGVSGILYMLLMASDYLTKNQMEKLVRPTVDYMMSLQFPSGNYPSSLGSQTDKLVHWCHGAPGFVHMLILAYKVFGSEKYLIAAQQCNEVIWKRGLLRKGYGICHGVAGNAYAFIVVYSETKNPKELYRAKKFAEWCFDYGKHGARIADRPMSLFEGLAGTIYFLADMLNPNNAAFPAFQLS